ncbi:heat shock 70 kDa protein 12A-like [Mercenaria mercenaria]|uniref:heat shock 70 kDa protein 12A-like n=1 Tax=Mercenaria mercenaria TaxID=6596 RepID=UPI001E1D99A2|nr:heat shock 70 kDa protein 12A-like [Mercenaria mercenaria]
MASTTKLIVAAIDFGTTFSGYAFSFGHDFHNDPLKIQTNHWIGGGHISLKAPTTVLFTPQKIFHSFGYDAEDKYMDLAEDENHKEWFYFRRFKMLLHENKVLSRKTLLFDEHNKPLSALTVFSSAIKYLKNHLLEVIQTRVTDIHEEDIHWVLTVPAIWNESAKQFMKEAGTEAGLHKDHLILALEPEGASVLCKRLPVERLSLSKSGDLEAFKSGSNYMVLDLGGGTVDITVHSVQADGTLSEIAKASGGAWGGTQVDTAFLEFLEQVVGKTFLEEFREGHTADFLDMMREFEAKKRTLSSQSDGMITMRIAASFASQFKTKKGKDLQEQVSSTIYAGRVNFRRDKIQITADVFKQFFTDSISNTITHVREIFTENNFQEIETILLVGGFAESEIVQDTLRTEFSDKRIITPNESGLVVLKGAVLFGHNPKVVKSRVSKYTYGVEVHAPFDEDIHPAEYKFFDGIYKCRYLFDPFVRAGQVVPVDEVIRNSYTSNIIDVEEGVGIYASTNEFPAYVVDDNCFKLGNIYLDEPDHEVVVEMQFGGTQFSVQFTDLNTGVKRIDCFDFLSH